MIKQRRPGNKKAGPPSKMEKNLRWGGEHLQVPYQWDPDPKPATKRPHAEARTAGNIVVDNLSELLSRGLGHAGSLMIVTGHPLRTVSRLASTLTLSAYEEVPAGGAW